MTTPQAEADRYRAAFDQAIVGMVFSDRQGKVWRANDAFLRLVGRSLDEVMGRTSFEYTHSDDRDANVEQLNRLYRGESESTTFQKRYVHKDGTVVWAQVFLSPSRNADGEVTHLIAIVEDITEQKRTLAELAEARRKLDSALSAGEVATYEWDVAEDRLWGDANFDRIFGVKLDPDGSGPLERFVEAIHPDDRERVVENVRRTVDTGVEYETEYRILTGGRTRWVIARGRLDRDDERGTVRFPGLLLDITERRKLAERLEQQARVYDETNRQLLESERAARAEAEAASRVKDEFLATLSHELRTPLSAVLGWAQILRHGGSSEEELREGLAVIEQNARAQGQIIEDLLDMSRIVSGKVRLEVRPIDLVSVLGAAIETVQPAANAKGVRIEPVLHSASAPINGDANRLQQVFWNLLSNAVKFTPRGGRVAVELDRGDSLVEVRIVDSGDGIAADFLPYVFDRFRQADASTTRRHGGLGLGLAIVKNLTELHGGSISVASEGPGHGAAFTVAIPLLGARPAADSGPERRSAARDASLPAGDHCDDIGGVRVLAVDDDPEARRLVKRFLEDCEATVTTVSSAAEALDELAAGGFDVLVSDVGMPGEDGHSLVRKLRASGILLPAIAVSAYARPEDRQKSLEAGFTLHLVKPIDAAALIAAVATLAGRAVSVPT